MKVRLNITKLYLIRHGQTDPGRERKYCGARDVPLNDTGRRQAELLAGRFNGVALDAVFASDLARAVQTAEISLKVANVVKLPCFREMDFGVCEGLGYDEARQKHADIFDSWVNSPMEVTLPGGESFSALCSRVINGIDALVAGNPGRNIVLVAHGGPIRVILLSALGRGMQDFWSLKQDNAALNVIEYIPGQAPAVLAMNDTEHLNGLEL
ncbi:MAG: histidine phosphatase family protein [Candidatus Omnitrophica bacterium]|nr:histidine phosphatase family protein [Candidatus Omnitrophota bacterium]